MSNRPTFRKPNLTPTPYHRAIMNVAAILSIILGCCVVFANVLGIKVISFGPIICDGGVFVFPITYIIGDVMVMLFDREITESVTKAVCIITIFLTIPLWLCDIIPDPSGVNNPSMHAAYGLSVQVCAASVIAFFVSRKVNNNSLRKKLSRGKSRFWSAFLSSVWGHIWDSTIFTFIAFWSRHSGAPFDQLLTLTLQALNSMAIAIVIEFALNKPKLWLFDFLYGYLKTVKEKQAAAQTNSST